MKKADDFDLKKYLVENKVTTNSTLKEEDLDIFKMSPDSEKAIKLLIKNLNSDLDKIRKKYTGKLRRNTIKDALEKQHAKI
jgi:hypothetical protein